MAFQMKFAVITPALIAGAFCERMRFRGYLVFIGLWSLVVYCPFVHAVWGGGFLVSGGLYAIDFAGGSVVHELAGAAALATALYLRRGHQLERPHSVPLVLLGAGILWFGWFGFNAGSALSAGQVASYALMNTQLGACMAMLVWMGVEWWHRGKPSGVGIATGAVGLSAVLAVKRLGAERIIALSRHPDRQQLARDFGATDVIADRGDAATQAVLDLTNGTGVDAAVECVGTKQAIDTAFTVARPGSTVGIVGIPHGEVPFAQTFFRNVGWRGGPAPARIYIPELMTDVLEAPSTPAGSSTRTPTLTTSTTPIGRWTNDEPSSPASRSGQCDRLPVKPA
jgi:hypothetical protein